MGDFSGEYGEGGSNFVIRRSGPTSIADIAPEDAGFYSRGCGTWSDDLSPVTTPGEPFPDGTYLVGVDIAPGRYRATAPTDRCLWFRLDEFGGVYGAYEGAFAISIGWLPVVDVAPSDAGLLTAGCGTWSDAATPIVGPGEPFGDGVYLVGINIAPGRYRASAPPGACSWRRLDGFRGDPSFGYDTLPDIIAYGDSTIVDILETDVGFSSSGCGAWSEVNPRVSEPKRSFGDGTYLAWTEIAPGRYFANAPSGQCEWRRLDNFGGHDDYAELGIGGGRAWDLPNRLAVVDIKASDVGFQSTGCGEWTQTFEPRVTPGGPPGDGFFLVGIEVAPGRYRANTPESCTFERRSAFSGEYYEDRRYVDAGWAGRSRVLAIVDIEPTDVGFESKGCAWERRSDAHQPAGAGLWRRHLRGRLGSRARALPCPAIRRRVLVDAAEQVRRLVRQRHRRRRSLVGPRPKRRRRHRAHRRRHLQRRLWRVVAASVAPARSRQAVHGGYVSRGHRSTARALSDNGGEPTQELLLGTTQQLWRHRGRIDRLERIPGRILHRRDRTVGRRIQHEPRLRHVVAGDRAARALGQ